MKPPIALVLLLAGGAAFGDDASPLSWSLDLESACERAGKAGGLVLLCQIVCECTDKACAFAQAAREPRFLRGERARALAAGRFVPAVVHVQPGREGEGLYHPSYAPADFRRNATRVRTLFLTPTRHILHRLDLCPFAEDAEGEMLFALRAASECYTPQGTPRPRGEEILYGLHRDHCLKPETCHKELKPSTRARPPGKLWEGAAAGPRWTTDLDEARLEAAATKRMILYFQVVGDLDLEGC